MTIALHEINRLDITSEAVKEFNELQKQLRSGKFVLLAHEDWDKIANQGNLSIVAARDVEKAKVIGMAILRWHDLPGGRVAALEDVVVDAKYRGMGYGEALVKKIMELAKKNNVAFIDLTSNPSRQAANELYHKLGWEKRDTNVYRLYL